MTLVPPASAAAPHNLTEDENQLDTIRELQKKNNTLSASKAKIRRSLAKVDEEIAALERTIIDKLKRRGLLNVEHERVEKKEKEAELNMGRIVRESEPFEERLTIIRREWSASLLEVCDPDSGFGEPTASVLTGGANQNGTPVQKRPRNPGAKEGNDGCLKRPRLSVEAPIPHRTVSYNPSTRKPTQADPFCDHLEAALFPVQEAPLTAIIPSSAESNPADIFFSPHLPPTPTPSRCSEVTTTHVVSGPSQLRQKSPIDLEGPRTNQPTVTSHSTPTPTLFNAKPIPHTASALAPKRPPHLHSPIPNTPFYGVPVFLAANNPRYPPYMRWVHKPTMPKGKHRTHMVDRARKMFDYGEVRAPGCSNCRNPTARGGPWECLMWKPGQGKGNTCARCRVIGRRCIFDSGKGQTDRAGEKNQAPQAHNPKLSATSRLLVSDIPPGYQPARPYRPPRSQLLEDLSTDASASSGSDLFQPSEQPSSREAQGNAVQFRGPCWDLNSSQLDRLYGEVYGCSPTAIDPAFNASVKNKYHVTGYVDTSQDLILGQTINQMRAAGHFIPTAAEMGLDLENPFESPKIRKPPETQKRHFSMFTVPTLDDFDLGILGNPVE